MMRNYKYCQSCGYPMNKVPNGGGTEKDGSINKKYCHMCYENGEFLTPPEVDTAKKMQKFCVDQMKEYGINGFMAWLLTRRISKLERWNN